MLAPCQDNGPNCPLFRGERPPSEHARRGGQIGDAALAPEAARERRGEIRNGLELRCRKRTREIADFAALFGGRKQIAEGAAGGIAEMQKEIPSGAVVRPKKTRNRR